MKTQLQVEIRGIVVSWSHRDVREGHPYQTTQKSLSRWCFCGMADTGLPRQK